ncbi:polysialyltransferase family glycosyltransferase [Desertihabitans aurantiacus]|uniref:polysialyltransferase family glycosyltransferase n=1 Tax=Desertihabitans aurantiacus TaxID=2282477 RepID=UPI000DF76FCD|nr:polysialyltransferase family glycosyltransferase [Desertihabitans aurantiacus]
MTEQIVEPRPSARPRPTVQLCLASTLYGTVTLTALADSGQLGRPDRRVLVLSNNSAHPETSPRLVDQPDFDDLAHHFDEVVDYNAWITPLHPSAWRPREEELLMWERAARQAWGIGEADVQIVCESIQAPPATTVCRMFPDATIDVYADGLMSYGPTRDRLGATVGTRIDRVLHLDLVPGLRPLLLSEWGARTEVVDTAAFRAVVAGLGEHLALPVPADEPVALVLGQYMSDLELITLEEETDLHLRLLGLAAEAGFGTVVFKPHPSAGSAMITPLQRRAEELGVRLVVFDEPIIAEVLYERLSVGLVLSAFSTALMTAANLYGIPVASLGTGTLLTVLRPYQNSNRIPLTIVDQLVPQSVADLRRADRPGAEELAPLLTAVAHAMQPGHTEHLRPAAVQFLSENYPAYKRYFYKRRLLAAELPGPQRTPVQRVLLEASQADHPRIREAVTRARKLYRRVRRARR